MPASRRLYARARRSMPSGVNSPVRYYPPYPLFVSRARGPHIWGVDGSRYTDLCNGYGALLLGHARPEVARAVSAQLRRGALYGAPTAQETELAEEIKALYPSAGRVRLLNTGAEAAMAAIRLARGHTKRRKIVKFEGCYHGAHDPLLVRAGSGAAHMGVPVSAGVTPGASRDTLVARFNDPGGLEAILRKNPDVAAVIVEPVPANMGLVPPGKGFLRTIRRMSREAGALLIFDEVVTGFRLGPGGAQKTYGIRPDITMLGKALGGGLPMSAVCGSSGIMETLAPGGDVYQASTFAGNPVSVAAALASLRVINRNPGMYPRLERACARIASAISDAAADLGIPACINHISSMFQVFFTDIPVTDYASARRADGARFARMFRALLAGGVFAAPSQFETSFLSAAHSREDVDDMIAAYTKALEAAR